MAEFNTNEVPYRNHDSYTALSGRRDRALRSYLKVLDSVERTDAAYDILFAVDDLLQDYYDLDDGEAVVRLREGMADLLPSDDMFNSDELHRQAKEMLLLFPLRYMAGDLVQSTTLQEAEAWYYHVGAAIIERVCEVHDVSCRGGGATLRCEYSTQCPWRVLRDALITPLTQPDLAGIGYALAPELESAFAHMKMTVAVQLQLITASERLVQGKFFDYLIASQQRPGEE